jgi:ATP-dependent protease Clp ATPase subunit
MENEQSQQAWEICSFCGASRRDVAVMIAGLNGAHICNNCIDTCLKALGEYIASKL